MNKEWENIIKKVRLDVEKHFPQIALSIDFGSYIQPDNYFVSYIFKTIKELNDAKQNGLLEEIQNHHKECMKKYGYPSGAINNCVFASQEECDRDYNGNWYYYYK